MIITFLGFDFWCPNKGCEALSYSFVSVLKELFPNEQLEIYNVTYKDTLGNLPKTFPDVKFHNHRICLKNPGYLLKTFKLMKKSDYIFDITYGDSFSDIYGEKWLTKTNFHKQMALRSGSKTVFLPQTYGPFKNPRLEKWSLKLIAGCPKVFSRDDASIAYLKEKGVCNVSIATDLAMALPYKAENYHFDDKEKKVGLNVSSLLWENGFTGKNEFGLTVNYREYCEKLISRLSEQGDYKIYLIPHVIEDVDGARENDLRAIRQLHEKYPETILPPEFDTPMDIKGYIANMDVFLGARMHATIAAYSSNVPVIPFSYSRKFEGLFGNLNYSYVIEGTKWTTEEALRKTFDYLNVLEDLKDNEINGMREVKELLKNFKRDMVDFK